MFQNMPVTFGCVCINFGVILTYKCYIEVDCLVRMKVFSKGCCKISNSPCEILLGLTYSKILGTNVLAVL